MRYHTHLLRHIIDWKSVSAEDISGLTSPPKLWKSKGSSTASVDDTEQIITWSATGEIDGGSDLSVANDTTGAITISTAGVYKFTVTLRTDNANRTELFIRTYIDADGASGYTQDTDEIVSDYVSRDTDQDTGSVTLSTALDLAAGAKVQFRGFGDTDGTSAMLTAGTVLLIEGPY